MRMPTKREWALLALAPVVILAHAYWQNHFVSDSGVVGRTLRIGGRPVEGIGVVQAAPFFPGRIDALMNMSISEHHVRASRIDPSEALRRS